jgi:hypothetical protein
MAPELALILAARQCPSLVVTCERSDAVGRLLPRLYGLAEVGQPVRTLVFELVTSRVHRLFGPLHEFVLMSPDSAGEFLVRWTEMSPKDRFWRKEQLRVVSMIRHRPAENLTTDKVAIMPAENGAIRLTRTSDEQPGEPMVLDRDSVTRMLTSMLSAG